MSEYEFIAKYGHHEGCPNVGTYATIETDPSCVEFADHMEADLDSVIQEQIIEERAGEDW